MCGMADSVDGNQKDCRKNDSTGDAQRVFVNCGKKGLMCGKAVKDPQKVCKQQKNQQVHQRAKPVIVQNPHFAAHFSRCKCGRERAKREQNIAGDKRNHEPGASEKRMQCAEPQQHPADEINVQQ